MRDEGESRHMTFRECFGNQKVIIGMVHLLPLPGAPGYGGDMEIIYAQAKRDLESLIAGGVTAAIVENFGDIPYTTEPCSIAVNAMAILLDRLQKISSIPIGVNVQYDCTESEWNLAYLTNAAFLRAEAFVENRISPSGICYASAPRLMRQRAAFACDAMVFADINVKHTFPMADQPIAFSIQTAVESGASAIIITGLQTGSVPGIAEVKAAKEIAGDFPVLIGSGISEKTIGGYLSVADGVIVGSAIKEDGNVWKPVDPERVRRLVACAANREAV